MTGPEFSFNRRSFLAATAAVTTSISAFGLFTGTAWSKDEEINILGPKQGYSPQIGTLVSEMTWMRRVVLHSVKEMSQKELDYLFDANANTIGALLLHRGSNGNLLPDEYVRREGLGQLAGFGEAEVGYAHGTGGRRAQSDQGKQS